METFNLNETLAIDFGTINSTMAYWKDNNPQLIMESTSVLLPSCCEITKNGFKTGSVALKHIGKDNVIYGIKRVVGRRFSDPITQFYINRWPFTVIKQEDEDKPVIKVSLEEEDIIFPPEDIVSQIISYFKTVAERNTNKTFKNVIVTLPAFFNNLQKETIVASFQSVFDRVIDSVLEPTAAAYAYCVQDKIRNGKVFVFDLGGGTFDITILQAEGDRYRVLGTGGDENLGGMDFTHILMDMIVEEVRKEYNLDVSGNSNLFTVAEKLKIHISYQDMKEGTVFLSELSEKFEGEVSISRDDFNQRCMHLFDKCRLCITDSLNQAKLVPQDIDYVVLIGGSSRIIYIETILSNIFGNNKIMKNIYPEEAVVKGAMLYAACKAGIVSLNNCLPTIGDEERQIIKPSPRISPKPSPRISPKPSPKLGSLSGRDISIEPIFDSLRKSFVMEQPGDTVYPLLKKGTSIPYKGRQVLLQTANDYDTTISINIAEGDEKKFSENNLYARLQISDIPPKPRGEVKVVLIIDVNSAGMVNISASTTGSKQQKATVDLIKPFSIKL